MMDITTETQRHGGGEGTRRWGDAGKREEKAGRRGSEEADRDSFSHEHQWANAVDTCYYWDSPLSKGDKGGCFSLCLRVSVVRIFALPRFYGRR